MDKDKQLKLERIEIKSRLPYIKDEGAKKVADFLLDYSYSDEEGRLVVPTYRVLDALSMINQERIGYCGGL